MNRGAAVLLMLAGMAGAHEIGTTRVTVALERDGRYDVEIVTDAQALADKLGGPFKQNEERFRQRVHLRFDGVEVRPEIEYRETPGTIRLTGAVPAGAKTLTWHYGWTFTTYSLRLGARAEWLEGNTTSAPVALAQLAPPSRLETAGRYLALGFTHILPLGLDHVLFVLGLYLLNGRLRTVLWQASAFTLAHTITLGLTLYGWLAVPASIVEPLIAVSIAYVAIENVLLSELKSWRIGLVFAFGLLHGMGFAGVLEEIGLPRGEFVLALVNFNLGVEAGQLAVIGLAFLLAGWRFGERDWYRARIAVPASVLIAMTAIYWTIERVV